MRILAGRGAYAGDSVPTGGCGPEIEPGQRLPEDLLQLYEPSVGVSRYCCLLHAPAGDAAKQTGRSTRAQPLQSVDTLRGGRSCSGLFTWNTSRHSWLARLLPFGEESRRPPPSESGTERKYCSTSSGQLWRPNLSASQSPAKTWSQLIEVFSVVSALKCGERDGGSDGIADCAGAQADAA